MRSPIFPKARRPTPDEAPMQTSSTHSFLVSPKRSFTNSIWKAEQQLIRGKFKVFIFVKMNNVISPQDVMINFFSIFFLLHTCKTNELCGGKEELFIRNLKSRASKNNMSSSTDLQSSGTGRSSAYRSDSPTPVSHHPLEPDPKHKTALWSLSWASKFLWNICSALKSSSSIYGHKISMFGDSERPYRRSFLRWSSKIQRPGLCLHLGSGLKQQAGQREARAGTADIWIEGNQPHSSVFQMYSSSWLFTVALVSVICQVYILLTSFNP